MQLAFMSAALMGACAGFLRSNWHPAKVFLGDAGSTFIGFMLAALAVFGGWASEATHHPVVTVGTPILILGVPIFDMIYITLARIRRGDVKSIKQWFDYVGRDHFHHRLLYLGLGVKQAVYFICTVSMILGLSAWSIHYTRSRFVTLCLLSQSILIFLIIVFLMLRGRELTEDHPRHAAGSA
jgi:UDP-GlcNAc:undecaprenyl-phosphate GlcNAc-1-phosphate transferase